MRIALIFAAGLLAAAPAFASPEENRIFLRTLAADVSPTELHDTDAHLVAFGTRHTLSDTVSDTRGVGAARRYVASRFQAFSAACGGCLTIETPSQTFTGERLPKPAEIVDVLAIQRGTSDPDRVVIISGHIDSRVNDVMDAVKDAPGANDDGSGTSAVIEAARVLSKHKFPPPSSMPCCRARSRGFTAGGCWPATPKPKGWRVEAQLNNDIIGNTHGIGGEHVDSLVRVFSEGTRPNETAQETRARRLGGGEDDSPSRNLSPLYRQGDGGEPAGFSARLTVSIGPTASRAAAIRVRCRTRAFPPCA